MLPAIQLYTLRNVDESLSDRLERVAALGYQGVEFAGLYDNDPAAVAQWLDSAGLEPVAAHVGVSEIEDNYGEVVETYHALGCTRLVIPWYEQTAFESLEGVREVANRLTTLADRLDDDGFELLYHNHSFEFAPLSDGTAFDQFVTKTDGIGIEFDTGLAAKGDVDSPEILRRYGRQIELVHLTDTRANTGHADLGTGLVDVQACVDVAIDTAADWLIFENGSTEDPIQSTENAIEQLHKYIN